ncbi:uncharacterized protein LOC110862352 isoform X2 [Folsomia candida]|uniref:uncharacterized protein LOC110862352 isoform X2 n=1 Tax=Folsomia candida TaxID=158441 RepID=UPI000B8F3792|nr:uncharacterized protein LOC110862352 isoform X2 [Folsomia candida]
MGTSRQAYPAAFTPNIQNMGEMDHGLGKIIVGLIHAVSNTIKPNMDVELDKIRARIITDLAERLNCTLTLQKILYNFVVYNMDLDYKFDQMRGQIGFSLGSSLYEIWVSQHGSFTGSFEKGHFACGGYNRGCIIERKNNSDGELTIYFGVPAKDGAN